MYKVSIFNSCDDEFVSKTTDDECALQDIAIDLINSVDYLDVGDKIIVSEV